MDLQQMNIKLVLCVVLNNHAFGKYDLMYSTVTLMTFRKPLNRSFI
jgi:hypothetical protein